MNEDQNKRNKRKKGNLFTTIGLVLIASAILLTAYNLWSGHRAGVASDSALDQLVPQIAEGSDSPDYLLNPKMTMPVIFIDGYEYIGVLELPTIDRTFPIFSTWNYAKLKLSPCRYTGSAYMDDLVIAAHNYEKHFGQIKNLRLGDPVYFTDMDGNLFEYEVMEVEVLEPHAIEEMTQSEWDLTLFTCTIGGRSRVTVRCEKTGRGF